MGGGCSQRLGRNLKNRPANSAAHHIVGDTSAKAATSRAILKKHGIDVDSAENGVWLPNRNNKDALPGILHNGKHPNAYFYKVKKRIADADLRGGKTEVLAELSALKGELISAPRTSSMGNRNKLGDWYMTQFFEPFSNERYQSFIFEEALKDIEWKDSSAPLLQESFGRALNEKLKPLSVIPNPEENKKNKIADISLLGANSIIILSSSAREHLEENLNPYGEFVPLKEQNSPYVGFHVNVVLSDSIVWEKSKYRETANGYKIIYKPTLDSSVAGDRYIFMLEESTTRIYISDSFLADCKKFKLTGISLKNCTSIEADCPSDGE
ncbi:AHH domain-containing protein [Pseudomonas sp. CDFA 602]|uniref:AHH domain-containing protein n=1 Tax=Pseudomonas californiensis TaxID=2829823 RepID=UPI0029E806D6|nr:AHH domain-containing protein [Pseudomonas californiensis]MCD5995952.1 AHH domain-containing protein [Pseudomonas californiensis]MCD6001607.1 AHH domain-containing protein [Pseudomonas californiensis]